MNEELFVSAWKKGIKKVGTEFWVLLQVWGKSDIDHLK